MASQPHSLSPKQMAARFRNARQSTGPRTPQGKRQASLNALRTGEYARLAWPLIPGLGEHPREYAELLLDLLTAHRPANAAERLLVEELAALRWQRLRNQRAQAGQLGLEVERLNNAHQRRVLELHSEGCDVSQQEVLDKGLLNVRDSRGKFQQINEILGALIAQLDRGQIGPDWHDFIRTLYGARPSMRGAGILNTYESLRAAHYHPPDRVVEAVGGKAQDLSGLEDEPVGGSEDDCRPSPTADEPPFADAELQNHFLERQFVELQTALLEEAREAREKYVLYLQEEIAITQARRDASLVPRDPSWTVLLRQENSIDRRIERKTRLLLQMQNARRQRKHRARASSSKSRAPFSRSSTLAPDQHE